MITFLTEAQVFDLAVAYFQTAHRDPNTGKAPQLGPRSFLGQEARALAQLIGEVLAAAQSADQDAVPGTYVDAAGVTRTRNSSLALDSWAYALGLPTGVTGQFGRKVAQTGTGGAATAVGTPAIVVATGAQLTDLSGAVTVSLRAGFTMGGGGTQSVTLDAVTTGEAGNLPVGTVLRWVSPVPGLAATVTLTTALSGGYDVESDVALAQRIVERLRAPLRGGSAADFKAWALEATDSAGRPLGIDEAYLFLGRNGTGSVDVVIAQAGTGSGRDPGSTKAAQVLEYIEARRPVGDGGVRVIRPYFPSGQGLTIRVRVEPRAGFAFDFDDEQGTAPLECVAGSSGTALICSNASPGATIAKIKAAIDNGYEPRVQVPTASASAIPFQARATAYQNDYPTAGKIQFTLADELPVDPSAGDKVYAGGAAVLPVALAVLAYVDGVGPSRASGTAWSLDRWDSDVSLARIGKAAIGAVDSAGEPVCTTSPNIGNVAGLTTAAGVKIAIGAGSETAQDFTTYDNRVANGPQMPECASVIVHKGGLL